MPAQRSTLIILRVVQKETGEEGRRRRSDMLAYVMGSATFIASKQASGIPFQKSTRLNILPLTDYSYPIQVATQRAAV